MGNAGFDKLLNRASAQEAIGNGLLNVAIGMGTDVVMSGGDISGVMEGLRRDIDFFKGVGKVGKSLGKGLSQGIKGTARAVSNAFTDSAEDAVERALRDVDFNGRVRTSGPSGAGVGDSLAKRRAWYADENAEKLYRAMSEKES